MNTSRKIIHIDMDAFYASVEQRDNPELRGKPIAVGGGQNRGVTTTASYEARKYGVKSAMPGYIAKSKCPQLIFVKPRFDVYKKVSLEIREIFSRYTDLIEPLSLDEAYLDVTVNKQNIQYATEIAGMIREEVFNKTQLQCSAGVSYCKFIAKIASDINKPNGLTVIKPQHAVAFIEKLPIEDFFGVGKVTAEKMKLLGIRNGSDLKAHDLFYLIKHFGKSGKFFYNIVRGIDDRPVVPDRKRKSVGVEKTLNEDIVDVSILKSEVAKISHELEIRVRKNNFKGRTITLKLKRSDFSIITRSKTCLHPIEFKDHIKELALNLINQNVHIIGKIRLIGISLSNEENVTLPINQIELPL